MEEEVRAIAERQQEVERQQKAAKEQAAAAAAAAERRECERQQQVAQQQERDRQQQIAQNQERERQQQEAQQQHQAIQQQAEQRSNQEDATASADASPDEMRKKLQTWKTFLRNLMTASSHGQAPTIADFHRLEDVPTYDECLERLQSLWEALQEPLRTLDPQQLLAFPDQLLELETWLCMAQLLLVLLRIYNRDAKDVVRTGWKPAALVQAQKVLRPYANQLIHTDLLFVVDQVGALLDEGYRRAIRASMKGVVRSPAGGGFGLSMNNQMAAATEGGSKSATPPAPNRPYNPLLDPSRTALDKNGLPIPNPRIKPPSHNSFLYPASSLFDGLDKSHFQAPERTLPQSPTDNTQTEYYHPACPSFKIDTCTASPLCKAPHHACAHWLNGKCKYGGSCKQSHDPWFKAQIHGGGLEGSFEPACRFFKTGTCVKGDNCARPHEACPHFLRGRCKFGVMCMGSHDPFFMSTFAAVDTSDVQMESMMGSILDSSSRVGRERADAPSPSPSLFSAEDTDSTPADTAMGGRIKEACWFFKTGTCTRGDDCTRPHVACRGFLAGYCRFGDGCRFSHDPFFLIESNGAGDGGQEGVGEGVKMGKKAWMKSMMCRDGVGCGNRKCGFLHPAVGKD
ncbi:hypothetical protein T440DRAFT_469965 [Plenodomus tracheiphilus IPT5]|uniref:mRNA 3'-end-processing protein n=1 Tax=Plenodomus tracheiphilus IPT5 TaxID=1408161 RepID=A0A6A7B2P4_9PLEO|nr:hypothetical protein T440DRAFT_469965 [Plenodomus tracheiphilus IPT5]